MADSGCGSTRAGAVRPRVLVVDGSRLVAEAVAGALGGTPALALALDDLADVTPSPADVAVVDGDRDPGPAIAALRRSLPALPVVLLVSEASPAVVRAAAAHAVSAVVTRGEGLAALRARLRAASAGRPAGPAPHPPARPRRAGTAPGLTLREREVGELLALGHSNETIAGSLGISVHTVRTHVGSILAKLGTPSRFAAADAVRTRRRPVVGSTR